MSDHRSDDAGSPDPIRITLGLMALVLLLGGQILLNTTPIEDSIPIPGAAWVIGGGAALFILALLYRPLPVFRKISSKLENKGYVAWLSLSVSLAVLAARSSYLFEKFGSTNYIPVVTIWLASALFFLMAFIPQRGSSFDWKGWLQTHWIELIIIGIIFLLGALFRFYKLGDLPKVIDGDEGLIGLFAQETISSRLSNPFALWENIGAIYLQAINIVIFWFGATPFSLRLLPATAGTLAILSTYLFAKQVAGKRVALIAAVLLAISHTHINFSRIASVSYIQGTWLTPLVLYFLLSGLEKRSSWRTALAGVLLAIHMSIYLSAQIVVGMLSVYMLIAFLWLKDSFRPAWRQAVVFWAGFLILIIPEGSYIIRNPAEFLSRMNTDSAFSSGWLANQVLSTGKTTAQILLERVIHAFFSLIHYPTIDFYGSPIPMMSLISSILMILGLVYALIKTRSLKFLLLNGYFWGATIAIGIIATPPSADSYRMLVALPAAIIMAAFGLDQMLTLLGMSWHRQPHRYLSIASFTLVSLLVFNIWTYYFDFLGQCRFGGGSGTRFAAYLGLYVQSVKSEGDIYLLSDNDFRYGTHGSVDFLTQRRPIINYPDPMDTLNPVSGETIIASPSRIQELRAWAYDHPGGVLHFQYDCKKPMLLTYQIP
jgi:4-amino-4-deoxy-L-arabinose transferase-like glycosyltransferase